MSKAFRSLGVKIFFCSVILSPVFAPVFTLAEDDPLKGLPKDAAGVMQVLGNITNWLFTGILIISVIMIIVAAYKYLFSGGSEEATSAARKTIVYAVIALAVAMLAKGVAPLVKTLLSVK